MSVDGPASVYTSILSPYGWTAGWTEGLQEQTIYIPRWYVVCIMMTARGSHLHETDILKYKKIIILYFLKCF